MNIRITLYVVDATEGETWQMERVRNRNYKASRRIVRHRMVEMKEWDSCR